MSRYLMLVAAVAALGPAAPATGTAPEGLSVAIVAPSEGSVVTGTVVIAAQTTGAAVSVSFSWSPDGITWQEIGARAGDGSVWSAAWDTRGRQGPVLIRSVATDGTTVATDGVGVEVDNVAPEISVQASPDIFSPNRDGRKDRTVIRTWISEAATVSVRIRRPGGATVRSWTEITDGTAPLRIEWNGRADGKPVSDGAYWVQATATDDAGLTGAAETSVMVDTTPPATDWVDVSPEPLVRQRRIAFTFRVRDRAPKVRVDVRVVDAAGRRIGRVRRVVAPGRLRVVWRAQTPGGRALFPGGYHAVLKAQDDAGNRSPSRRRMFRVHRPTSARVFTRVPDAGRRVALTFDDCHVRSAWSRILDVLRQKQVQATFFCPGQMVRWNPDLARRTVRDGHTPASHAWDHAYLPGRGVEATASRLRADARAWWDVTRATSAPYFRPPYGAYDRAVLAGAGQAFHPRVMLWDVDTNDWRRPGSSVIASRAVQRSRGGSVVLMHTLDQTAAALPSIIDGLRRRGLRPVSLPELFRAAGLP